MIMSVNIGTPFYFSVANLTGAEITQGFVTHVTESNTMTSFSITNLASGSSITNPNPSFTSSGQRDYWYVGWTNGALDSNGNPLWVTYAGTSSVHGHGTLQTAGNISLYGQLGGDGSALELIFQIDDTSTSIESIVSPW